MDWKQRAKDIFFALLELLECIIDAIVTWDLLD